MQDVSVHGHFGAWTFRRSNYRVLACFLFILYFMFLYFIFILYIYLFPHNVGYGQQSSTVIAFLD